MTDATTGDALADVEVRELHDDQSVTTDPVGHDRVSRFTGAAPLSCPDIVVEFSKTGYQTVTLRSAGDVSLVRL